ncbi:hypothetical protein A2125_00635 [Candidatus Woesebacteria bacterium GWB1_43_5]|uniref:Putative pre-16S rRNA nuclease n=1 Tax=Candidatus Woesebacteria bacterium GWB1_43_5 TaxID=1802474 RepID=A0A1F7WTD3_9BACT|nr:MAG: hypothetical protein A2125_00635 [Candidatus Woesebacteria bacterium GWB1_43_5]
MKILGIDYGRSKIGLALGDTDSRLAEPWKILRYKDIKTLGEEIKKIIDGQGVEKVVVGVSEGKMGEESNKFSLSLRKSLKIPVETFDETLSTYDAQRLSIEAGIQRKKRKGMEDAYSAVLILQSYLEA